MSSAGRARQDADAGPALEQFAALRARSVGVFRGITDADLSRPGNHEETGAVTLGGTAEHIIAHDVSHLAQIARAM